MSNKVKDPYENWEQCPFCGGKIRWGEIVYDYNMEALTQECICYICNKNWYAVYKFAGNLNSNYEEFEEIEEEEDDDEDK